MGSYDFELDLNTANTMSVIDGWITDGAEVLEFGPAYGRLTRHLSRERNCRVTIVERDEVSGREAARYAVQSYVGAEEGDINRFCWCDTSRKYDYIIFADVLEHLPEPDRVLEKCRALMAPRGAILVSIPNIAHNSILIDLWNDSFVYGDAGLLDRTHIHFFTYRSFYDMVDRLGLGIVRQQPVYSRVGWNEISARYEDVPYAVEQALRARKSGSIYQYVFCLRKKEEAENAPSFQEIEPCPDEILEEEASCFFWPEAEGNVEPERTGILYPNDADRHCFRFSIGAPISRLRFDPMEGSCILRICHVKVKPAGSEAGEAYIVGHNAVCSRNRLYYFKDRDPQLEIDIRDCAGALIDYVEVCWEIVDSHLDTDRERRYDTIFGSVLETIQRDIGDQEALPSLSVQEEKWGYREELTEARLYGEHLWKDIERLKQELAALRKESSEYIAHCEKDLAEVTQYARKLEADLEARRGPIWKKRRKGDV